MTDAFGREIDYIRISITDRCNLRCAYCMPGHGVKLYRHEDMLTYEEIVRLCRVFASEGIRKIKLTGGEPLARKNIAELMANIKAIPGIQSLTLTTNGALLEEQLDALVQAGVDSINISLDTLNRERYCGLTGVDALDQVLRGLDAVLAQGIRCKINCVPLEEVNRAELMDIAALAKENPLNVRFIELMPIGCGKEFTPVPELEIAGMLQQTFGEIVVCKQQLGNGPCIYYSVPGFMGNIGFISAMSKCFCASCNRIRLTSTGFVKSCLHYNIGMDIRTPMRDGCSDRQLRELLRNAVARKPMGHGFTGKAGDDADDKHMAQIGG